MILYDEHMIGYEIIIIEHMASEASEASDNSPGLPEIQQHVEQGHNIFLTGPGGVGKSYYIKRLKEIYGDRITITSTTGVSSYNLTGRTIHSFSGLGAFKRNDTFEYSIKKIKKNPTNSMRWKECEILVIDEISMMGKQMLEMLDKVARHFRDASKPFGGIQVIFTGDFLQLPPVEDEFAFLSPVWDSLNLHVIYLTKMFRVVDPVFTQLLERFRVGQPLPEDNVMLFARRTAYLKWQESMEKEDMEEKENKWTRVLPTWMYSRKVNVAEKNMEELDKNPNEEMSFSPIYTSVDKKHVRSHDGEKLRLKIGAQVMLCVNFDVEAGLVNGSRGVVTRYDQETKQLHVKFLDGREIGFERYQYAHEEDGKVMFYINQYPFILAYALSIHKVQGCTLDFAVMDLGYSVFENSMSYVALSRVRSLEGLFLTAYQPFRVKCDEKALEFYQNL